MLIAINKKTKKPKISQSYVAVAVSKLVQTPE